MNTSQDDRFNLTIPIELARQITLTLDAIKKQSQTNPLAVVKLCLKLEGILREFEDDAAQTAHGKYKVAWDVIGRTMGYKNGWAIDRYVKRKQIKRRSRELVKEEMEGEPKVNNDPGAEQ